MPSTGLKSAKFDMIHVYNTKFEDHTSNENNYYIGRSRGGNVLGNPYTYNGKRSNIAKLSFRTADEAIRAYGMYFDAMYGTDKEFTRQIDEIYEKYKNGEEVYLQCFCKPNPCHGDVIVEKLQQRLIKERLDEMKKASSS